MEVAPKTFDGLQLAGDTTLIDDTCFDLILSKAYDELLNCDTSTKQDDTTTLASSDQGIVKQAYAAVLMLLLESAKHDRDAESLGPVLEDAKFSPERIVKFSRAYTENKPKLHILLSSIGNNSPHIVDVDWRLDYYIKNNQVEKISQPTYLVSLKTEECGEVETQPVQFACSQEQLQDMVGKLRDACKSLERAANM